MTVPPFSEAEYRARAATLHRAMGEAGLSALVLTTEAEIAWLTGFVTRFWQSPTRPWVVILPLTGDPVAIIPQIGAALMARTWVTDIRPVASPAPDDVFLQAVAAALREAAPPGGVVALPDGPETHVRLPLAHLHRLRDGLGDRPLTGDGGLLSAARRIKSPAEIARIRAACGIATRALARVPEIAAAGRPLDAVARGVQALCLEEGADDVGYLACAAGPGGYGDIISPAEARPLVRGDVLMLDLGVRLGGYWSDVDRNHSIGPPSPETAAAHARLVEASAAGFAAARPGATHADLFRAMDAVLTGGRSGARPGRLGHGVGLQLTEGPSILPWDTTPLRPGMVLTLEPAITLGTGRMLVHEEVIAIGEEGPDWLTPPAGPDMAQIL